MSIWVILTAFVIFKLFSEGTFFLINQEITGGWNKMFRGLKAGGSLFRERSGPMNIHFAFAASVRFAKRHPFMVSSIS